MKHLHYVRRAKSKLGFNRHKMLHAADSSKTFCGRDLDEMWFIESPHNLTPEDIGCALCRRAIQTNTRLCGDAVLSSAAAEVRKIA